MSQDAQCIPVRGSLTGLLFQPLAPKGILTLAKTPVAVTPDVYEPGGIDSETNGLTQPLPQGVRLTGPQLKYNTRIYLGTRLPLVVTQIGQGNLSAIDELRQAGHLEGLLLIEPWIREVIGGTTTTEPPVESVGYTPFIQEIKTRVELPDWLLDPDVVAKLFLTNLVQPVINLDIEDVDEYTSAEGASTNSFASVGPFPKPTKHISIFADTNDVDVQLKTVEDVWGPTIEVRKDVWFHLDFKCIDIQVKSALDDNSGNYTVVGVA